VSRKFLSWEKVVYLRFAVVFAKIRGPWFIGFFHHPEIARRGRIGYRSIPLLERGLIMSPLASAITPFALELPRVISLIHLKTFVTSRGGEKWNDRREGIRFEFSEGVFAITREEWLANLRWINSRARADKLGGRSVGAYSRMDSEAWRLAQRTLRGITV